MAQRTRLQKIAARMSGSKDQTVAIGYAVACWRACGNKGTHSAWKAGRVAGSVGAVARMLRIKDADATELVRALAAGQAPPRCRGRR